MRKILLLTPFLFAAVDFAFEDPIERVLAASRRR